MFKSTLSPACLVAVAALASAPFLSSVSFAANGFACSLPVVSSPSGFASENPTAFVLNANTGKNGTGESLVVLEEGGVLKTALATQTPVFLSRAKGASYAFELNGKALTLEILTPSMSSCGRGGCDLPTSFAPFGVLTHADGVKVKFSCQDI